MYTIKISELKETSILAASIAESICKEERSNGKIIYLYGDLGSGKTTLVRYFLQSFGIVDNIKSPSFSIMEQYYINEISFYHFDFYRFNHQSEVLNIGLNELKDKNTIMLIEWPEKAIGFLPKPDLEILLSCSEIGTDVERYATLSTQKNKEEKWLTNIISAYKHVLAHT
ncbi:ATPase with strong ADP affinity [Candidatus Kinetoplastibacterium blastocrithidii TCC012E]|uniref:tRNA threonylcarbamoyladenosine biosynthesis protein TsaE n=1 Tax=Candidatus Kinetoplastidibacterium blastocrithidiae TCC012E TaxID=1208922 RepID=M1LBZ6_9PROT|nr:tRNA (adenosine(37)-N6)-threonylcarbamoyltransferase complex ATPase subunit type 1 TsaE [Candidatus Kinetoplastibacterium blastocrithidii]AFZ83859.1 ATPase [Candidatus Kinetoplastibacterium blastocrithidii (ex Strigomonas culicis)]AGF49978.1 ATPase with strong ADP affinity [Candidatus Kinetoplastibacterium blastocrithidii TCC012E]